MLYSKKNTCFLILVFFIFTSCMSRTPVLTETYMPIDNSKSCEILRGEIRKIEKEMQAKLVRKKKKTYTNVALGVAGALVFFPALFFMDLSDADRAEYESLRKRHDFLISLCVQKKCGFDIEPAKSLEEMMREEAEKRKGFTPKADAV